MMTKPMNPTELARETLKQLAVRRMLPTPDHYEEIYNELAGTVRQPKQDSAAIFKPMLDALGHLPQVTPESRRLLKQAEKLSSDGSWSELPAIIIKCVEIQNGQGELGRTWAELIRDLIKQWDIRSSAFPTPRKRESLERVLINFGKEPKVLNEKLDSLVQSWRVGASDGDSLNSEEVNVGSKTIELSSSTASGEWLGLLISTLELGVVARLTQVPSLQEEARSIIVMAKEIRDDQGVEPLATRLRKFWLKLELQNETEQRLVDGLMGLLQTMTDNVAALAMDDQWVGGQIQVVKSILQRPLDMRVIYEAENSFREVMYKQGVLKQSLNEARDSLKSLITSFIDRLGKISDSTQAYHGKITHYASEIEKTDDILRLKQLVENLMTDTRGIQMDVIRSRDELEEARQQAINAEKRVHELENELTEISNRVREDHLTGALNRRGFDETVEAEMSRAERSGKVLSVAMLDLDNFKKLNDRLGHQAGDEALIHLVRVVREALRPTDSIARFGGEEFVILLPETEVEEAAEVLRRLQRELTKRFFLHNNEKVLITFSCGVTSFRPGESEDSVVSRADEAMYEAKKSGKNRVVVSS